MHILDKFKKVGTKSYIISFFIKKIFMVCFLIDCEE